jgi:hypothetical protein
VLCLVTLTALASAATVVKSGTSLAIVHQLAVMTPRGAVVFADSVLNAVTIATVKATWLLTALRLLALLHLVNRLVSVTCAVAWIIYAATAQQPRLLARNAFLATASAICPVIARPRPPLLTLAVTCQAFSVTLAMITATRGKLLLAS